MIGRSRRNVSRPFRMRTASGGRQAGTRIGATPVRRAGRWQVITRRITGTELVSASLRDCVPWWRRSFPAERTNPCQKGGLTETQSHGGTAAYWPDQDQGRGRALAADGRQACGWCMGECAHRKARPPVTIASIAADAADTCRPAPGATLRCRSGRTN